MPRFTNLVEAPAIVALRNSIVAEYGSDTTGMNIDRINKFLAAQGIQPTPWVRVPPATFAEIIKHCKNSGFLSKEENTDDSLGIFIPRLGMSLLLKVSPKFRRKHPQFEDVVLVHEQVHGSAGRHYGKYAQRRGLVKYTSDGYSHGDLFEEGLATIVEDMYLLESNGGSFIYRTAWSLAHDCIVLLARCEPSLIPALRHAHAGGSMGDARHIIYRIGGPDLFNILYAGKDEAEHTDAYEATLRAISQHPIHRFVLH